MSQTLLNLDGRLGQSLADFPVEDEVSLERLLTNKFVIDWFEAVAILLRTCEQSEGRSLSFDPAHVIVRRDGSVHATATAARSSTVDDATAVQNAAALLRDLLPETFPAPLRLALTQALSTPPSYQSIREFSSALEYFERPDRSAVVRALFDRWRTWLDQQRRVANAATANAVDANTETQERKPPSQHGDGPTSRRRAILWGIASAATVAVVLTFWIVFASRGVGRPGGTIATAAASVMETVASTAGRLVNRLTFSPSAPDASMAAAALPAAAEDETSTVAPTASSPISRSSARPRAVQVPLRAFSARPLFDPFGALTPPLVIPRPELNAFLDSRSLGITVNPEAEPRTLNGLMSMSGSRIYSAIDTDVAPPVAVYPHLPASAFVARDEALMFDVVIDETGRVESVKSLQAAATMGNTLRLTMNLSAAKSWRFQPAMKDGLHVKYRHTVWLPLP